MKIVLFLIITVLMMVPLAAQSDETVKTVEKAPTVINLSGVFFQKRDRFYDGYGALDNFKWSSDNWGVGSTVFIGHGPLGVYSSGGLFIPSTYEFSNGYSADTSWDGVRIGLDNISGVGFHLPIGPRMGIISGLGVHLDLVWYYKDIIPFPVGQAPEPAIYFDLGLGAGGAFYFQINEAMNIHFGGNYTWDFMQLHSNSKLKEDWAFNYALNWSLLGGIGIKY